MVNYSEGVIQNLEGRNIFKIIFYVRLHAKEIMDPTRALLMVLSGSCHIVLTCLFLLERVLALSEGGVAQSFLLHLCYSEFSASMRSVANTPGGGKAKEVSPVRRSGRGKQAMSSKHSNTESEDVEECSPKPRVMKSMATDLMYPMVDFQTFLDVQQADNVEWLQSLGLYEFAMLPWESYAKNIYGPVQMSLLQTGERLVGTTQTNVEINTDFIAQHFCLPNEGETTWEKASDSSMQLQFGKSETTRGYYVLKRVSDANRRLQLTWIMERLFLLVKLDYMSRDTFGGIIAAESGMKINWAHVLYSRIVMDVRGLDKRKQSGVTKISAFLCRMYEIAKQNNWHLYLAEVKAQKSTKFTGKPKKGITIIDCGDDEPPEPPVKKSKVEDKVQDYTESSKQEESCADANIVKDMMNLGFQIFDVKEGMEQGVGSILKDDVFKMSIKDAVLMSASKIRDTEEQKKTIRIGKSKILKQEEARSSRDVKKNLFTFPSVKAESRQKTDDSARVKYTEAMKSLEQLGNFFQQREDHIDAVKEENMQLKDQNRELRDSLTEISSKKQNFTHMVSDIDEMKHMIDVKLQERDCDVQELKKQLSTSQLRTATVKQWIEEDKGRFVQELNVLAENNVVLQTSCQVLQERLRILSSVEQQLKASVSEEVEVDGIFISNDLFNTMIQDVVNAGQSMWEVIQQRLVTVIQRPYQMFNIRENTEEDENLSLHIEQLK